LVRTHLIRIFILFFAWVPIALAAALSINITGIKGDVLDNVKSRLTELYQGESFNQDAKEQVRKQIETAMYPYGYFAPRIRILSKTQKSLTAHINPGPQIKVTSLSIELTGAGKHDLRILKARHALPLKPGKPFINSQYKEAKEALLNAAEHQGYLHGKFTTSEVLIDKQKYTVNIKIIFDTGPQYFFGQVRFDPTYVCPELLYRYVPFQPGQPYSTDQILAFESNLSSSGYFKSVVVKPNIDTKSDVPVDVHLERIHRINYTLGVGYGTDTGPRGRAALHVTPVNRRGHKFNAIAQGSAKENALLAQYLIPGRNPLLDNYSLTGSVSNLDYSSGYGNAFQLSLAHQHATKRHQRTLSINGLVERFNYTYQPKTTKSLLFPKAIFAWTKTTDPLFSPSGYNLTLTGLAAGKFALSEINMGQATLDAKAAITVDAIRTRFFAHTIQGLTGIQNINDLPLSLAMLLGGAQNLQGYGYNSIGPGKYMTYGGIEIQKETWDKWYVVGFVDAGDVYKPTPRLLKYDAGVGLMWVSPVGPIKVALAQPLDNHFQRVSGSNPRLVINMGPDL
jgi:translocation and assembly module TamA